MIAKDVIVAKLRERGQHDRAAFVEKDLPDSIDPARHAGLLAMLKLRPEDLVGDDLGRPTDKVA
jgi:hypothetical protein